ncbi:MAG TPA: hypothetical protein VHR42_03900, partial [Clostridia bacterium]|nr:hypothetical protein [Clostridia bacterium]
LIPKVCFEELGMFQEEIRTVSDYDFWYRMLLAGWRLLYVSEYLVQGRVHPRQVTYRMSGLAEKEFDEFHYQLCRSLYFEKGVRSWKAYWFIGRCALKRGFTGSASLAFHLASDNMPSIFYRLMYLFTRLECFFARRIKSLAKSLFSRLK